MARTPGKRAGERPERGSGSARTAKTTKRTPPKPRGESARGKRAFDERDLSSAGGKAGRQPLPGVGSVRSTGTGSAVSEGRGSVVSRGRDSATSEGRGGVITRGREGASSTGRGSVSTTRRSASISRRERGTRS